MPPVPPIKPPTKPPADAPAMVPTRGPAISVPARAPVKVLRPTTVVVMVKEKPKSFMASHDGSHPVGIMVVTPGIRAIMQNGGFVVVVRGADGIRIDVSASTGSAGQNGHNRTGDSRSPLLASVTPGPAGAVTGTNRKPPSSR